MRRLELGEMPDHIEREFGLTPTQQHKIIRTEVSRVMRERARRMAKMPPYPFNRGVLDFTSFDASLVRIEAWLKIRKLKRRYDRMNAVEKAENKDLYARQINAMLHYMRNAFGPFDPD